VLASGELPQDIADLDFNDTSGDWGGSMKFALAAKAIGARYGCTASEKRTPEENEAAGGSDTSDHLTTMRDAYAVDLSGCSMAFPGGAADRAATDIAAWLRLQSHVGLISVVRGSYRFQLIWQSEGHYDHVHLGVRLSGPPA
jgi:hypothetical protein